MYICSTWNFLPEFKTRYEKIIKNNKKAKTQGFVIKLWNSLKKSFLLSKNDEWSNFYKF